MNRWQSFGLPVGDPSFASELKTSSGIYVVHVTGEVAFNGFISGSYRTMLPTVVKTTVAKRVEEQDLDEVSPIFEGGS